MKTLMLEFYKIKRRKIGLTMAAYLIAQFLWGLWALHDPTPQAQAQGFLSLLYYISVLDAVMVPPIMAVLASRLADIEHKGCMYKQLKTLRGSGSLFHAKAVCGLLIITVMFAAQYALFILLGYMVGYQGHPDAAHYILSYGLKLASNSVLFLLQLMLSMLIANQMVPLVTGLCGSLLALLLCALCCAPAFAASGGSSVADVVEKTWKDAAGQIKTVVDNVVFPALDMILAVAFFGKLALSYFDYKKHGQFEWTGPVILFACLVFVLTAPLYIWTIVGL